MKSCKTKKKINFAIGKMKLNTTKNYETLKNKNKKYNNWKWTNQENYNKTEDE